MVFGVIGINFFIFILRFFFIIVGNMYELFIEGVIKIVLFILRFFIKLDIKFIFLFLFEGVFIDFE